MIRNAKWVVWLCSMFFGLDACVPTLGSADGLNWQPVRITTETIQTPNEITTQPNISNPCQSVRVVNESTQAGPPAISKFGQLDLDSYATGVAWSPDGKYIATSEDYDRIIKIWRFPSLSLMHTIDKDQAGDLANQNLLFTHDSKYLITASIFPYNLKISSALSIFEVGSGSLFKNVPGYDSLRQADQPSEFQLSRDGRYLFVQFDADNSNLYVYNASTWLISTKISLPELIYPGPGPGQITMLKYAPVTNPEPSFSDLVYELVVWDLVSSAPVYQTIMFPMVRFPINAMASDSSACDFVFGAFRPLSGYGIKIFDTIGEKVFDLQSQTPVSNIDVSTGSHTFAFITDNSQFNLLYFDARSEVPFADLMTLKDIDSPDSLSFSADGRFLAAAGDRKVVIYRIGAE